MKLSLRLKTMLAIIISTLVLSIVAVGISYYTYADTMDKHYERLTLNLAHTAATQMDGEKIQEYLDTKQLDANYDKMLGVLRDIQESNGVKYIYILQLDPQNARTVTVMDTDSGIQFGKVDDWAPGVVYDPQTQSELVYISNTDTYGWLCSSMVNLYDAEGEPCAVVCVDISMNEVMQDRYEFLELVIIAICLIMLACAGLMVALVGKFIVNPINQLAKAAGSFVSDRDAAASGELSEQTPGRAVVNSAISRLSIRTGDEIQSLAEAIQSMEREINLYIEHLTAITAEKERIGAEMHVAQQIQSSMLPSVFPPFPNREDFDLYATMEPAKEVGGDFYDFFLIDPDHLAIVIADVSGKGVPAALFMVIAKTLIKNYAQDGLMPQEVFIAANRQLCETNETGLFVTAWMGVLTISTGQFVYVNAGHNPPLLKRRGEEFAYLATRPGFVLAGLEETRYRQQEMQLCKGDVLYLYTDGVTEANDPAQALYGEQRLKDVLNAKRALPLTELLHAVRADLDAFADGAPQFDDITMLGLAIGPLGDGQ